MGIEKINLQGEKWLPVKGWEEQYEVSNCGRVKSKERIIRGKRFGQRVQQGRIMKLLKTTQKYSYVWFQKNRQAKQMLVHRLVGEAFLENPENKPTINHINGVRHDNRLENLEWATQQEQVLHAYRQLGRKQKKGAANSKSRTVYQYNINNVLICEYGCTREAAEAVNATTGEIWKALQLNSAVRHGYIWRYEKI